MGRVTWSTFDRLTAAQVQTVSDQTVMRFATTTARDAALGVGVREVGMVSAVAAAPDNGAPRYWDGSTWALISAGVQIPNILATAATTSAVNFGITLSSAANTWHEITSATGANIVIFALDYLSSGGGAGRIDIGTGPASSEVVRWTTRNAVDKRGPDPIPYGVYVPAGTRIAVRTSKSVTSLNPSMWYWVVSGGTAAEAGESSVTLNTGSTAWVEVAATPPKAGGVEVIGIYVDLGFGANDRPIRLGIGASGAEVDATGDIATRNLYAAGPPLWFPPFTWPAGTRLAARFTSTSGSLTPPVRIFWRESLSV